MSISIGKERMISKGSGRFFVSRRVRWGVNPRRGWRVKMAKHRRNMARHERKKVIVEKAVPEVKKAQSVVGFMREQANKKEEFEKMERIHRKLAHIQPEDLLKVFTL